MTSAPATLGDFRTLFSDRDRLSKTLVVELDGEVVGDLMLAIRDGWAQTEVAESARGVEAELGWVLHPRHSGHGFASEAVRALIRVCFRDLGLRRVTAGCFADNERSWRLMERVGMRREGHAVAESLHRSGRWLDTLTYAMLAADWRNEWRSERGSREDRPGRVAGETGPQSSSPPQTIEKTSKPAANGTPMRDPTIRLNPSSISRSSKPSQPSPSM